MPLPSPLKLILASQSRRRRELATSAGWDVTIIAPPEHAEASAPPLQLNETVPDFVTRLAHAKAAAVATRLPFSENRTILACDTVGEIEGVKADTRVPQHSVTAGCATSVVFMEPLQEKEIDDYLSTNEWCGKAGACGFQDGLLPLRLITGSADTVVGLPVEFIEQLVTKHLGSN